MDLAPILAIILSGVVLFTSAYTILRWGFKIIPLYGIFTAFVLFFFRNSFDTASSFILPAIYGIMSAISVKKRKSIQFYLLGTTAVATLYLTAHYYYSVLVLNIDLLQPLKDKLPELIAKSTNSGLNQQLTPADFTFALELIARVMPFNFFFSTLMWASICFFILRLFFASNLKDISFTLKGLEFYRLNDYFVFVFIVSLAGFVFIKPEFSEILYFTSVNALLICSILYILQSIGILRYIFIKKKIPLYILPLGLTVLLLFSIPVLPVVAILLAGWGILDLWADFRGLQKFNSNDTN